MKKSDASQSQPASELISKRIAELGDWRGETLSRMRRLIQEADPDVVEEWKWRGIPVWSHESQQRSATEYAQKANEQAQGNWKEMLKNPELAQKMQEQREQQQTAQRENEGQQHDHTGGRGRD